MEGIELLLVFFFPSLSLPRDLERPKRMSDFACK
jgi:hypothetical protein